MESTLDVIHPRTYIIKRSQHNGYGFVAGGEFPTIVKITQPHGPSYKRLLPNDVIMAVNGIDVENYPKEKIIKIIELCDDQIEIKVRQASYEELIRAKNLADPKYYTPKESNSKFHFGNRQTPLSPASQSPLNRLVTSISQQEQPIANSPYTNGCVPPVQIKPANTVLKQKLNNGINQDQYNNGRLAIGRSHQNYGRHSPVTQRCKSSVDGPQNKHSNKKPGDPENDQPLLKRSNTMRPYKPPRFIKAEVKEMLEVLIMIFIEPENTRVLPYNQDTTVGAILETLNARLSNETPYKEQIKRYFGIALDISVEGVSSKDQTPKKKLMYILDENDSILKIRQLPYRDNIRLLYRMVYPPSDVSALYIQDKVAFEYLYQQSRNDLRFERFCPELDQETALKLCALHLLEYVHTNHSKAHGNSKDPKVYIKLIKKSPGIEYFLPSSMARCMLDKKSKYKKLTKLLAEHLKKNFEEFDFEPPKVKSATNLNRYSSTSFHELSLPEMQSSPSDYIKLQFLHYLSQLPCYGNYKWPVRASTCAIERSSGGDCSSSLESVPRTSDSSPLIKQDRNSNLNSHNINGHLDNPANNNISRLAQMNSMRSLSSVQSSSNSQPVDQTDMVQTPSIESISSITFNMQSSPSPQQTSLYSRQQIESYNTPMSGTRTNPSPSSILNQHTHKFAKKSQDEFWIDRNYGGRYQPLKEQPIDELLKTVILLPPPPPSPIMFDDMPMDRNGRPPTSHLTQILTDRDLEKLRVPPPPKILN